jgi:hypothetical protein
MVLRVLCTGPKPSLLAQARQNATLLFAAFLRRSFSRLNHSCRPSASYAVADRGGRVTVRLLRSARAHTPAPVPVQASHAETHPHHHAACIRPDHGSGGHHDCGMNEGALRQRAANAPAPQPEQEYGEEVTIAYVDPLAPRGQRLAELFLKYGFVCACERCQQPSLGPGMADAGPPTPRVDQSLSVIGAIENGDNGGRVVRHSACGSCAGMGGQSQHLMLLSATWRLPCAVASGPGSATAHFATADGSSARLLAPCDWFLEHVVEGMRVAAGGHSPLAPLSELTSMCQRLHTTRLTTLVGFLA